MKSQVLIVVLLGLSLGTAGAWEGGADISGTWAFSVDTNKSKQPVNLTFIFKQHTEFVGANVLLMKLEPIGSEEKTPQLAARYSDLLKRVEAIPGVKVASLVGDYGPVSLREWFLGYGSGFGHTMFVQGFTPQPGEDMQIPSMQVYPNSFAALGINLLAGRDFSPQDIQKWMAGVHCQRLDGERPAGAAPLPTRVGIINESMARQFFPNENPVGRRFGFDMPICGLERKDVEHDLWIEVIGVAQDVNSTSHLRNEGRAIFYLPFSQTTGGHGRMTLVVRTADDPMTVAAEVRAEARALDPQMPMFEAETLAAQGEVFTGKLSRGSGEERITGTVKGNKVVFRVEGKSGGWEPFKHTYTGAIESPTRMSGTIEFAEGSSGKWTATKK